MENINWKEVPKELKIKLGRMFKAGVPIGDIMAWWALRVGFTKTYTKHGE